MTTETDYETRKTARCNRIARDPLCAIADFVRWHTKRGFAFTIQDEECEDICTPRTKRVIEILRAVYEVEIATFSIVGPNGKSDGRWVTFMFPSACNCSPEESVSNFGVNAISDAWSEDFYKRCDAAAADYDARHGARSDGFPPSDTDPASGAQYGEAV